MAKNILSLLPEELEQEFKALGEPKFRAKQVFEWLSRGVRDFEEMSNLPKSLRDKLKNEYELYNLYRLQPLHQIWLHRYNIHCLT